MSRKSPIVNQQKKRRITTCIIWLVSYVIIAGIAHLLIKNHIKYGTSEIVFVIIMSLAITLALILLVTLLFGRVDFKNGVFDFIIGDEGTYSLSRLQSVLWAITIIASQIQIIESLLYNNNSLSFIDYQPIFSDSSLWLIALSLSSYIAVKGITTSKLEKKPSAYKKEDKPEWKDILTGSDGLDFSRCQMLVWTIIAIATYTSKCYEFDRALINGNRKDAIVLFSHMYDEYNENKTEPNIQIASPGGNAKSPSKDPYVPYLPWSFVVLMGLSQGTYIGKKLVPTFKLDDIKEAKQEQLDNSIQELLVKQTMLNNIVKMTKQNIISNLDQENLIGLQSEIRSTQQEIISLNKDIKDIDNFKS